MYNQHFTLTRGAFPPKASHVTPLCNWLHTSHFQSRGKARISVDIWQEDFPVLCERHLLTTTDELNVFSAVYYAASQQHIKTSTRVRASVLQLWYLICWKMQCTKHSKAFQRPQRQYHCVRFNMSRPWQQPYGTIQRIKEKSLTLNRSKCKFNKSTFEIFGFVSSANSIQYLLTSERWLQCNTSVL